MSNDWQPSLQNISICLAGSKHLFLSPEEFGFCVKLVWHVATITIGGHYTEPSDDPGFDDDDKIIRRLTGASRGELNRCRASITEFFVLHDGRWRLLDESMVRTTRANLRNPIPMAIRSAAMARDGRRCVYCGDTSGPFHFDHLFPVSKGGGNDLSNIVVSCVPCNMSKGSKTLAEWVGR